MTSLDDAHPLVRTVLSSKFESPIEDGREDFDFFSVRTRFWRTAHCKQRSVRMSVNVTMLPPGDPGLLFPI